MERPKFNRERLKINKKVITFVLTIGVIFIAGFLGVLSGFYILIKPELEISVSTTISTTTTTIPITTSTTTTITTTTSTTTVKAEPCSPCFEYFSYLGHNNEFLSIKNGLRSVKITRVTQTKGGSVTSDFKTDSVNPGQNMLFKSDFEGGTQITIQYVDVTSGNVYSDSATLH